MSGGKKENLIEKKIDLLRMSAFYSPRKSIVIMTDYLESSKNSFQNSYMCVCVCVCVSSKFPAHNRNLSEDKFIVNRLCGFVSIECQWTVMCTCLSIYLSIRNIPKWKEEGGRRGKKDVFFSQQEATRLNETSILIFTPHTFKLYSKYCCCCSRIVDNDNDLWYGWMDDWVNEWMNDIHTFIHC